MLELEIHAAPFSLSRVPVPGVNGNIGEGENVVDFMENIEQMFEYEIETKYLSKLRQTQVLRRV